MLFEDFSLKLSEAKHMPLLWDSYLRPFNMLTGSARPFSSRTQSRVSGPQSAKSSASKVRSSCEAQPMNAMATNAKP